MARDDERLERAQEAPIVGGLPDVPGIVAAMRLTPGLGIHLRGLADELLVNDFPGATISRAEREMIATAVSAAQRLLLLHGFACGASRRPCWRLTGDTELVPLLDGIKLGSSERPRPQDARAAPDRPDGPAAGLAS